MQYKSALELLKECKTLNGELTKKMTRLEELIADTQKVLPCPYCGAIEELEVTKNDRVYFVFCKHCGTRGPNSYVSADSAITYWNRRVAND